MCEMQIGSYFGAAEQSKLPSFTGASSLLLGDKAFVVRHSRRTMNFSVTNFANVV